ncbi:MAG: hypothetical protein IIA92_13705 [Chloroflexi bacterium]|nr:hypothetical protein [Chloroflexota bacterium]
MPQVYTPHPRKAEALELFNQGLLARDVAVIVEVKQRTVHRWAAKERVDLITTSRSSKRNLSDRGATEPAPEPELT